MLGDKGVFGYLQVLVATNTVAEDEKLACDMPRHSSRRGQLVQYVQYTRRQRQTANRSIIHRFRAGLSLINAPCRTGGQDRASSALLRMQHLPSIHVCIISIRHVDLQSSLCFGDV